MHFSRNNNKIDKDLFSANLEKLKSANLPLNRIKENLKNEFKYQFISIILVGFVPFSSVFPKSVIGPYYLLYSIAVAVTFYYLIKLHSFYKRLNKVILTTKDSLYETYLDIRLNMELYKTFGFALTPFVVLFSVGVTYYKLSQTGHLLITNLQNEQLFALASSAIITMLFMGLILEWWVNNFYGKYAKEIRSVLDELKE